MNDTAIIVTSYTGGPQSELKKKMTKVLCKTLRQTTPYYICLATHSTLDEETQNYCHGYVYDCDNSFDINGVPPPGQTTHGMAEVKSIHNALNYLERFKFKNFFKIAYDNTPIINYNDIIQKCKDICSNNKSMVTAQWGNNYSLGVHMFYSTIEFYRIIYDLERPYTIREQNEINLFNNIRDLGLMNRVHIIENYDNFLGYNSNQYSHHGGNLVFDYPFE